MIEPNGIIPLIRFVDISSDDFFDKVRSYKAIIPYHFYEEVAEFYYKKNFTMSKIWEHENESKFFSKFFRMRMSF